MVFCLTANSQILNKRINNIHYHVKISEQQRHLIGFTWLVVLEVNNRWHWLKHDIHDAHSLYLHTPNLTINNLYPLRLLADYSTTVYAEPESLSLVIVFTWI